MSFTERSFYFMRHGQTDWNVEGRYMGCLPVALNEEGRQQAEHGRQLLNKLDIKKVFYSPLERARETMEIATADIICPKIPLDELKERCLGNLEGQLKISEFKTMIDPKTPSGGEALDDFLQRVIRGVNIALAQPGPVLIIAHSGTYRVICHAMGFDGEHARVKNGQLVEFVAPSDATGNVWDVR